MNVQPLNKKDKKKSLSGQKKKNKRSQRTILTLPGSLDIKNPELDSSKLLQLTTLLKNLLPTAKLPQIEKKDNKTDDNASEQENKDESESLSEARRKRNQLLPGINVVSKGVKNDTVACVIFADDILPRLMTTHLKVLCSTKKVPYVSVPGFRHLTRDALGFPCIALGIKKDTVDFIEIKELICTEMENEKFMEDTFTENDVMLLKISKDRTRIEDDLEKKKEPFKYLCRDSKTAKRQFIPDPEATNVKNESEDFIPLGKDVGPRKKFKGGRKLLRTTFIEDKFVDSVKYSVSKSLKLDGNPSRESDKRNKF